METFNDSLSLPPALRGHDAVKRPLRPLVPELRGKARGGGVPFKRKRASPKSSFRRYMLPLPPFCFCGLRPEPGVPARYLFCEEGGWTFFYTFTCSLLNLASCLSGVSSCVVYNRASRIISSSPPLLFSPSLALRRLCPVPGVNCLLHFPQFKKPSRHTGHHISIASSIYHSSFNRLPRFLFGKPHKHTHIRSLVGQFGEHDVPINHPFEVPLSPK